MELIGPAGTLLLVPEGVGSFSSTWRSSFSMRCSKRVIVSCCVLLTGTVFDPQALKAIAAELANATVMTPLCKRDALKLIVIVPVATKPFWMAKRRCLVVRSSTQPLLELQAHFSYAGPWLQEWFPPCAVQPCAIELKPCDRPQGVQSNLKPF
jgi:hypothetical protein